MIKEQPMRYPISIILLFSLLLFACRSQDSGPAVSDVETIITLAAPAGFQAAYERLIEQFQEDHPRIQVQFVPLSGQQAGLSLREQAALADIVLLEGQPPTAEAAAAFLDLTPLMAADPTFDAADFWPGIMDACRAAGVQVGLPFRANASLIFFDKAAFDAAGLPHPEPGWNWEDFRQAAQALAISDGEQTARYGFVDGGNPMGLLSSLVDNIIAQSGDRLDGRRIAAELGWYVTLANEDVILSESGTPPHERQAAMWVNSQFGLTAARTALGDDLGVVAFPAAMGVSQSNPVTAGCALISAGTNYSQAAWTFANYLSQQALFANGLYPAAPARPSVAQSSGYWEGTEATTAVTIRTALEQGWYRRAEMPELTTVGNALSQALASETTLAESLPGTVEIQPTAPPPSPDMDIAVVAPRAAPETSEDTLVIEYFPNYNIHSSREAVVALATAFNQSQERFRVTVVDRPPPYEGVFGPLEMAEVFDCFAHNGYIEPFARFQSSDAYKEAFYSLDPFMFQEDVAFQEDFDPFWLARNQIEGELFALPGQIRPYVIYYNRDLLHSLELELPSPEWTVDDFWTLVQAAAQDGNERQIYGFAPGALWPSIFLLPLAPAGEYPFDQQSDPPFAPTFDSPTVLQTLIWFEQMVERGAMYPSAYLGAHQTLEYETELRERQDTLIRTGRAAMWLGWAEETRFHTFNTGVAPLPHSDLPGQAAQASMFLISKRTADPTGCWEWLKFLTVQPDAFTGVPMRRSIREAAAWLAVVGNEAATAYEIMVSRPGLQATPPGVIYPYIYWWSDILHIVFNGESPASVVQRFQTLADAFYACYWQVEEPDLAHARSCTQEVDPNFWQGKALPATSP
jgi:ABC-type glycerol-3-phosphate transport system substrate-binding protein